MQHRIFYCNGADLAYLEEGKGEPVVFVHGTLGSLADFNAQVPEFATSFRTVAYSRRYHPPNRVAGEGEHYSMWQHAADLAGLLEQLTGPSHVVGSSFGGYVALMCALQRPELFRCLVLGEPPILPLLSWSPRGRVVLDHFVEDTIVPVQKLFECNDMRGAVKRFVGGVTGQPDIFDRLPVGIQRNLLRAGPSLQCEFRSPLPEYMPEPDRYALSRLFIPVLLVEGETSPEFFHLILDELERILPRAERRLVPRAGHTMHSANTEAYNEIVAAFLTPADPLPTSP